MSLFHLMLVCACSQPREKVLLVGDEAFREGDLVLRCGYGAESRAVTETSQSVYSHIGMLHWNEEDSMWMVIHAVPGEAEGEAPEWLKCEPIVDFYAVERAMRGAWMRVDCPKGVAEAAVRYAWGKVQEKVEFDNDYLLTDTTRLYCTELVWQAFLHQGVDLCEGRHHSVPKWFSKDGECIFPCDIEESSKIKFVKPLKTKKQ